MEFPNRHKNHVLESASERFVKYHLPSEWIFTTPSNDYGIDLICEVVEDEKVIGLEFGIQLKAKRTENNSEFVTVKGIKRSTINYWLNSIKPVILIVYVEDEKKAYYKWIKDNCFDLTKENAEFQIKINKKDTLSEKHIENISFYVKQFYLKMFKLKNLPEPNSELAWQLYIKGNHEEALPYFKKMPKSGNVLCAISLCYYSKFQYKNALIYINKALKYESNNSTFLSNKASILIELGETENDEKLIIEGLKIIELLIDEDKITTNVYYNYGNGLGYLGLYREAEVVYKEVLESNPNKAEAWKNLGMVYHNLNQFDKEIECYDKSLLINPHLIQALTSKGNTLMKVYSKFHEALALYKRVLEIDKEQKYKFEYPYVDFYIAECYFRIGNISEAKKWNGIGLENNPTDEYFLSQKSRFKD